MREFWDDPLTGQRYPLVAFQSFTTHFMIKHDRASDPVAVPVFVRVSNHCYTRKRDGEPDEAVFDTQTHKDGTLEERVFSPERWAFAQELPNVIQYLADKQCLESNRGDMFYRQEGKPTQQSHEGWYWCLRLDYRHNKEIPVQLSVRSVHWRHNRPNDTRGKMIRFKILLARFLNRKEGRS